MSFIPFECTLHANRVHEAHPRNLHNGAYRLAERAPTYSHPPRYRVSLRVRKGRRPLHIRLPLHHCSRCLARHSDPAKNLHN